MDTDTAVALTPAEKLIAEDIMDLVDMYGPECEFTNETYALVWAKMQNGSK
jgi:hypothetical protein